MNADLTPYVGGLAIYLDSAKKRKIVTGGRTVEIVADIGLLKVRLESRKNGSIGQPFSEWQGSSEPLWLTLPVEGLTWRIRDIQGTQMISIHAEEEHVMLLLYPPGIEDGLLVPIGIRGL